MAKRAFEVAPLRSRIHAGAVAGLAAAWELSHAAEGLEIVLLEGSDRVGGKLRLETVAGAPVDVGAESVLARHIPLPAHVHTLWSGVRVTA